MKSIVFEYTKTQKSCDLPILTYSKDKQLNTFNGEIFINLDDAMPVSKTFIKRETDDEPSKISAIYLLTKTNTQRESDE